MRTISDIHWLTACILRLRSSIRRLLLFFIAGLVISGLTAFPIESQLRIAMDLSERFDLNNELFRWLKMAHEGVTSANASYPFISYGTDWLAFTHLVIAVAFLGPLRDPIKNIWVIEFGLIACVAVFPLALVAGSLRGIPLFWRLIDCSFGLIGGVILMICHAKIRALEKLMIRL